MSLREIYDNLVSTTTTAVLNWWITFVCNGYASFHLSLTNTINAGYAVPVIGFILIPFGTLILFLSSAINFFFQISSGWANYFILNIDLFNYIVFLILYSFFLFLFVIKYLPLYLIVVAIIIPLIPVVIYLFAVLRSSATPAADTVNSIVNFFDYSQGNPVLTTYLVVLFLYFIFIGLFFVQISEGGIFTIGLTVFVTVLLIYPSIVILGRWLILGQDLQTTADETTVYFVGLFKKAFNIQS